MMGEKCTRKIYFYGKLNYNEMEFYVESLFFPVVMFKIYANEYHLATNFNYSLYKIFITDEKNFQCYV
jgi:hypothetical protein